MNTRTFALTALLLLAACGQSPARSAPAASSLSGETATPAPLFLLKAAMIENYQLQAAVLAQTNAQSQAVKAYAAAAVEEHRVTLRQLTDAARASGMPAPNDALDENYRAYLDMLRHASSANFDTTYASQQALVHMAQAGLYDSYTTTAPASPLRQWAQAQAPSVHAGIVSARQLASHAQ